MVESRPTILFGQLILWHGVLGDWADRKDADADWLGTRKLKLNGSQLARVRRELAAGISPKEVARNFGVSQSTLYAALAREKQQAADKGSVPPKRGRGRPKKVASPEGAAACAATT